MGGAHAPHLRDEWQQDADAAEARQHVAQLTRVAQLGSLQDRRGAGHLAAPVAVHARGVVQRRARGRLQRVPN